MQYDWVRGLVKHPRVLEVVRAVLGPDILLLDSRFICKYPVSRGNRSDDVIAYENGLAGEETAGPEKQKEELVLPYVAWHQDMRWVRALMHSHLYIQWGKKVFSQPPIVQVLPLKKMRGL